MGKIMVQIVYISLAERSYWGFELCCFCQVSYICWGKIEQLIELPLNIYINKVCSEIKRGLNLKMVSIMQS